jgi:putative RNA 2'-phosphotransferase
MIPYEFSAERFSRWMAYVLRHNPERYGLAPDKYGYVDLEEFLRIAGRRYPDLTPERIRELIESGGTARFEVAGSRIRARYGHSISVEPVGPPVEPPPFLYYGTEAASAGAILAEGLKPADRRSLHLSTTPEEALTIAQRKTTTPAVFRVRAQDAHRSGIAFYRESALYLAGHVPAEFLSREPLPEPAGGESHPQPGAP